MSRFTITREQAATLYRLLDSQERTNERVWVRLDAIVEELDKLQKRLRELEQTVYELSNRQ